MRQNIVVAGVVAAIMAAFVLGYLALTGGARPGGMGDMGAAPAGVRNAPPVKGFADGQEILFIHTEASDGQVADMLTRMMGSPVLVVPALAKVPDDATAPVYVFKNGVKGEGPFGFQPDVFDRTPSAAGYSPLRRVHLVTWKDEAKAKILRSVNEITAAERVGEVSIERPGAVVNMPMLIWPGGHR